MMRDYVFYDSDFVSEVIRGMRTKEAFNGLVAEIEEKLEAIRKKEGVTSKKYYLATEGPKVSIRVRAVRMSKEDKEYLLSYLDNEYRHYFYGNRFRIRWSLIPGHYYLKTYIGESHLDDDCF